MSEHKTKKKTVAVLIKMTPEVKADIEQRAGERNLTVTDFLTRAGLARATRQRADVDAINLLRACADELKEIHTTLRALEPGHGQVIDAEVMNQQMREITGAILRVWNNGGAADDR